MKHFTVLQPRLAHDGVARAHSACACLASLFRRLVRAACDRRCLAVERTVGPPPHVELQPAQRGRFVRVRARLKRSVRHMPTSIAACSSATLCPRHAARLWPRRSRCPRPRPEPRATIPRSSRCAPAARLRLDSASGWRASPFARPARRTATKMTATTLWPSRRAPQPRCRGACPGGRVLAADRNRFPRCLVATAQPAGHIARSNAQCHSPGSAIPCGLSWPGVSIALCVASACCCFSQERSGCGGAAANCHSQTLSQVDTAESAGFGERQAIRSVSS